MAIKRKKQSIKTVSPAVPQKSGPVPAIITAAVIITAGLITGIIASGARETALKSPVRINSTSPDYITITDTAMGKTSKIKVEPASAGVITESTTQASAPVVSSDKAQQAAARVAEAARTNDYSYLLKPVNSKDNIPHIDIEEAKYLYDSGKALFVDARSSGEYREGHIKGAVFIPVSATPEDIENLKSRLKDKVLITYCHGVGCHLSDKTAYKLYDAGYRKVAIFFSGWPKWTEHNYPVGSK